MSELGIARDWEVVTADGEVMRGRAAVVTLGPWEGTCTFDPPQRSPRARNEGQPTRRELRRFARRVLRAVGLGRWRLFIRPIVELADDGHSVLSLPVGACSCYTHEITLSSDLLEWQRYTGKLTALHEIAHALGPIHDPDHGPEFMVTFADLVKRFMGGGPTCQPVGREENRT